MGHSANSRHSRAPGGPGEAGTAQLYERMSQSDQDGSPQPFIPPQLIRVADGSIPDVLKVTLDYIDQLPQAFREALPKYFLNKELLSDLRDMLTGFDGIRRRDLDSLTEIQLEVAATPNPKIKEFCEGLDDALFEEPLPRDVSAFARANILRPLEDLAETLLPHPLERSLLREWVHQIMEAREREGPQGPSLPEPR